MSEKLTQKETCNDDSCDAVSADHWRTDSCGLDGPNPVIAGGQGRSAASMLSAVECLVILFCTGVGVAIALIILASFPSGAPCLL
ncbi:MAG: hypothetical protein V3V96_14730 [Acidiferrobacterales bacterium]